MKPVNKTTNNSFDLYAAGFPEPVQVLLRTMRETILQAAPGSEELISYGMPSFKMNGIVAHFAAHKNHIGFYPGANGIKTFEDELANYVYAKGSVQFPFDQPLPLSLIKRIIRFRVKENKEKAAARKKNVKTKKKTG